METTLRPVPSAVGGPQVHGPQVPAATAEDAKCCGLFVHRIAVGTLAVVLGLIPILYPLPDVPCQILNAIPHAEDALRGPEHECAQRAD